MPYVKSISVRVTVHKTLKYILNPNKTEGLLYTSSMNCMTSARDAYLEMKSVFESYSTERFDAPPPKKGKGSVKAIHYIQSFDPKDNISPELAHRIAKAFVRKTFGDDCQVVIATHTDRGHIHSHILVNTYTLTGRKLNANKTTLDRVKEYSDRVCLAFGIQPYDKSKGKGKTVSHHEWEKRRQGNSWKQKLRAEIDSLIGSVKNLDELLYELELKGYDVKKGKYISLKAPGQQRFIRTKTLGAEYTAVSLTSRILWGDVGSGAELMDEPSPLRECYETVIGQVIVLATEKKRIPRRISSTEPYSPENDLDVHRLSAQLTIISRDHIRSIGELEGKIESAKASYEQARQELTILTAKQERLSSLIQQAETYFDLSGKTDLTDMEQLRLTVSRQSVQHNGITHSADLDRLRAQMQEIENQIVSLKEQIRKCQQKYTVYADIAKTYREISQGDYISKLTEEERKRQAAEKSRRKKNMSL